MHGKKEITRKNYCMKEDSNNKALSLKTLTKSNVWDIQENDIFRMLEGAEKDTEVIENLRRYTDIIKAAFLLEDLKDDSNIVRGKYEKMGYKIATVALDENTKLTWAVKKRPIMRVSDLTYENIQHISAAKLVEVLERNFGGGWDSLPQSIQDIIESGFEISTTTLPQNRLHKPGGMYDKKIADGFEVLEVLKGTWVEAIFVKVKPQMEKPRLQLQPKNEDDDLPIDDYKNHDDIDDEIEEPTDFNDDDINEDNYRTTFVIEADPDEEAGGLEDYVDEE